MRADLWTKTFFSLAMQVTHRINEIEQLKKELSKAKSENARLTQNIIEIANLIAVIAKVSDPDPNLEKVKEKLALIVNREIRMHKPIPFISESLLKYKPKNISL
jgi:septal ring factor EnvC (AmiA/AmiB activator)